MTKEYNHIYNKLVDSSDDIHGIIAYSVYKRQKIQLIKKLKDSNNDKVIDDKALQSFNEMSMSPAQLEFYRNEATVLTQRFLLSVLEEDLAEREKYFSTRVHLELSKIKPKHFLDILKGAAGSLVFILFTGALYFAVWSLSTSPKMVIEQIFNVKIVNIEDK